MEGIASPRGQEHPPQWGGLQRQQSPLLAKLCSPSTYLTVRQEAGTLVRMTCSGVGAAPVLPGTLQTPQ